ncbi:MULTISPECIES: sirohydrochlorin chelatase [unclassified Leifsonia]|uniref:sirohydrochlorin chelatase n=1 Tax=unclassified Leifsonia TaxID=2663824 RepID=UPI0006FBDEDC|nr:MULTISPECIES: CbiX/SirB N-terminal domain-containing protein [unclassified Leifsonia]KQX07221.1 cobalamin biosynthesis protein CbiX [Leifsonia sp. Root1293]KRA11504.1 cobalamin biosynthesis protein CbiX [Leifsonia sp. Root60]
MSTPALLAVSHGTSSPDGQDAVARLVAGVAESLAGTAVSGGFVDVQQPDVPVSLSSLADGVPAVVVPLLLSAGYHVHVDLRREIASDQSRDTALAAALGPDDRLVAVLAQRLHEAGLRPNDRVVLAAAGSSDARAVADCREMGRRLATALGRPVNVGFLSAATPRLPDAVAMVRAVHPLSRVVVSTYLLAPGYFADLVGEAGADVVTAPLLIAGDAPPTELVDIVVDRYDVATRASRVREVAAA